MNQITPIHVHSCFSLLDSILTIDQYVEWAKNNNIKAIGLTDHGECSGLLELFKKCKSNDIKPILGMEAYLTEYEEETRDNCHLIIIAKNLTGYHNLIKIHNFSYDNYYYKPRVTYELLKQYKEGLIITSACLGGTIAQLFLENKIQEAKQNILKYKEMFKDDFYLELQEHGIEGQEKYNSFLLKASKHCNIKTIIQNDSHYATKDDAFAHEVLLCKNTGKKISDPNRMKFDSNELYLKTAEELREMFPYLDDETFNLCIENTNEIASKCEEYDILQKEYNYPKLYETNEESLSKLKDLIIKGFKERFKGLKIDSKVYLDRINYEVDVINQLNTVDYFLLLEDICRFCKNEDIYTNFSRGSGLASLVLYCLYVTHLDPIKLNLPFERFLNIHRKNAADFDLDIADKERDKVVQYVYDRFGHDKVCAISTYGTFTAKASFKAISSILELPFNEANPISALINPKEDIETNLKNEPKLAKLYEQNPNIKKIFDVAKRIEGAKDKRGIHASGYIISNKDLNEICPCVIVNKDKNKIRATSFQMKELDNDLKLLKIDLLGLNYLSIVKESIQRIDKRTDVKINFKKLEFNDEKTYKMLQNGDTDGVFQIESSGMRALTKRIKPTEHKHLDAIVSLFRPGSTQFIDEYVKNKNEPENIKYIDDRMKPILDDTYGIYCYQEQVMSLAKVLAGYNMAEADELRYAIGKKNEELMKSHRNKFINGCIDNGMKSENAIKMFNEILAFANYSFNRSHSAAYSALSYVTAFLKCNYSVEYMCSLLNSVSSDVKKVNKYMAECFKLGIKVLPPDINISTDRFEIDNDGNIRYGFSGVKGLGNAVIAPLIAERESGTYTSIWNLIDRVPNIDKSALECLLRTGALRSIESNSKGLLEYVSHMQKAKSKASYKKGENSLKESIELEITNGLLNNDLTYKSLFEQKKNIKDSSKKDKELKIEIQNQIETLLNKYLESVKINYSMIQEFTQEEMRINEVELIGYPLTSNPFAYLSKVDKYINYTKINELLDEENNQKYIDEEIITIGEIKSIRKTLTKAKKEEMCFINISYFGNEISVVVFPNTYRLINIININEGDIVMIKADMKVSDNSFQPYNFILKNINKLSFINNEDNKVLIDFNNKTSEDLAKLTKILTTLSTKAYNKNEDIRYIIGIKKNDKVKILDNKYWISNRRELRERLYFEGLM